MKKRFKSKRRIKTKNLKILLLLLLTIVSFKYYMDNIKQSDSKKELVSKVLFSSNYYSDSNILNDIYTYLKENIFNSPTNILESEIGVLSSNEVENTRFSYKKNNPPKVYIYNSHQSETYSSEYLEEYNIVPNVLMASNMLKDKLENMGITTIVEESDITAYMKKNNLNHAGSYIASRHFLEPAIENYKTVELFIDLHRDAAKHKVTYINIDGKDCAKIMFVIGLDYSTYKNNLEVATKLNNIIESKYPGLSRGIMKKQGYGVNGVYNQDLASNVILIEVGGNENNIDEINNTLDLISVAIGDYINEK